MQIKKGPFGYFAYEKFDSPDILCTYAEEVIAGNKSDFYIEPGTEYIGSGIMCYFEFSGYMQITDPEFSVFSSGKKLSSRKKEAKNLSLRRKSVGDLFCSFIKLLDNLISPSLIVIDPDMIFTDADGITIKLCCLPIKSTPENLSLSSLDASKLEKLLSCDFFSSILTDDEKSTLVFSVKEDNEELFLKTARIISGNEEAKPELPTLNNGIGNKDLNLYGIIKNLSKSERDLYISCISAFLSLVSLITRMTLPCILLFALSLVILVSTFLNQKKQKESAEKERMQDKSRQRSSILFSENGPFENTEKRSDKPFNPMPSGKLMLLSEDLKANSQYSVYLDETYIGSDCFLSDIVLDEPEVSPLHAVIRQKNGAFYLEPAKGSGKTYLEDSPIENGKSYEIKSGQKITIGNICFRFTQTTDRRILHND